MPELLNTFTEPSEAVQGPESWVKFRRLPYAMIQAARRLIESGQITAAEDERQTRAIIQQAVAAWNWVDDEGAPLPQPATDPQVIDRLNGPEVDCLMAHASGQAQAKN